MRCSHNERRFSSCKEHDNFNENQLISFDQQAMYISLLYKLYLLFCTCAKKHRLIKKLKSGMNKLFTDLNMFQGTNKSKIRDLSQSNLENYA